jgi:hypothetical protein
MAQSDRDERKADQRPDAAHEPAAEEYDYTEAIEANSDLVERLRSGDVHALASLIQAATGKKVTSSRIIESTR